MGRYLNSLLQHRIGLKIKSKFLLKKNQKQNIEINIFENIKKKINYNSEGQQTLDIYWDDDFIKMLDSWGSDNTWLEIQLLLANCFGKVLDIACGSGPVIEICKDFKNIELYGSDISDKLLKRAHDLRDIPIDRLFLEDATNMSHHENWFDFSYSIGSLEHFTEEGIDKFCKSSA